MFYRFKLAWLSLFVFALSCSVDTPRDPLDPGEPLGVIYHLASVIFPEFRPSSAKELKTFWFPETRSFGMIQGTNVP